MKIFSEEYLSNFLASRLEQLRKEVTSEPNNRILNVNEIEYRDYLVEKYDIVPLNFQWERMNVSDSERLIRAENFPSGFNVQRGESYPKQVLTFHIPFVGDKELLRYKPSPFVMWSREVDIRGETLCIDFVNYRDDPKEINREFTNVRSTIQQQLGYVLDEVVRFNRSLLPQAEHVIQARRNQLLKMSNLLESLGVPVRKSDSVPESFVVPIQKTKPIIKPSSSDQQFAPEPSLSEDVYREIVKISRQTGIEMERHPSIYFDKSEETLRDHFLMVLSPHFQSVTGETFNKGGKTDILIRHEKSNVFVAECKFWKGERSLHAAIAQILSYLTWRDSKAALFLFVRNKDIEGVITTATEAAIENECYVAYNGTKSEGWLDFDFRLAKDSPRSVRLSILFFHFPPEPK